MRSHDDKKMMGNKLKALSTKLRLGLRNASYPDFWLFLLGGTIGWISGIVVTVMSRLTQLLHRLLFQIPFDERLSSQDHLVSPWLALVPAVGGIVLVIVGLAFRGRIKRPTVDPIEANALHGGQMSLVESLLVGLQTMISSGFGASVGLEAGYTQASAAIASKLALALNLRRAEVRLLVGCGAAAAISAAFNAPLAGAFYAFETIMGAYNVSVVAPVLAAAMTASFAARLMGAVQMPLLIGTLRPMTSLVEVIPYLFVGGLSALFAIAVMRLVILCERAFNFLRCPIWLKPVIGGLIVGAFALVTPHILSSGHGALHVEMEDSDTWQVLILFFGLKALASSISLGSGFRGGLFFASLYLGLLFGKGLALALLSFGMLGNASPELFAIVGMASLAVGIVGGPMTMTFLIMESTLDLGATGAVLSACIVSSTVVRSVFGFSFSTWRLHLRGESIMGAHDVGRVRGLTVASLMRKDVQTVPFDMQLEEFRQRFPLGSHQRLIALDEQDQYVGLLLVTDAYSPEAGGKNSTIQSLLKQKDHALLPAMSVDLAAKMFKQSNSEELVVLDSAWSRKVIGLLTEQHMLRRYSEELDKSHRDLAGLGRNSLDPR